MTEEQKLIQKRKLDGVSDAEWARAGTLTGNEHSFMANTNELKVIW